ncbi:MAG: HK97 gp10 family phage protein [Pseudoalteromonas sp.]|nr:HK97 gp10 family phage protein [Pseudoalteromonas sp.]
MSQWSKLNTKQKNKLTKLGRAVALQMTGAVDKRSPVDTGRFRSNWFSSVGAPSTTVDGSGAGSRSVIKGMQPGDIFYFVNNLPYGHKLEYESHSEQAPHGMVRITIAEFSPLVDAQVKLISRE